MKTLGAWLPGELGQAKLWQFCLWDADCRTVCRSSSPQESKKTDAQALSLVILCKFQLFFLAFSHSWAFKDVYYCVWHPLVLLFSFILLQDCLFMVEVSFIDFYLWLAWHRLINYSGKIWLGDHSLISRQQKPEQVGLLQIYFSKNQNPHKAV